jgi:hypothetical protein
MIGSRRADRARGLALSVGAAPWLVSRASPAPDIIEPSSNNLGQIRGIRCPMAPPIGAKVPGPVAKPRVAKLHLAASRSTQYWSGDVVAEERRRRSRNTKPMDPPRSMDLWPARAPAMIAGATPSGTRSTRPRRETSHALSQLGGAHSNRSMVTQIDSRSYTRADNNGHISVDSKSYTKLDRKSYTRVDSKTPMTTVTHARCSGPHDTQDVSSRRS